MIGGASLLDEKWRLEVVPLPVSGVSGRRQKDPGKQGDTNQARRWMAKAVGMAQSPNTVQSVA